MEDQRQPDGQRERKRSGGWEEAVQARGAGLWGGGERGEGTWGVTIKAIPTVQPGWKEAGGVGCRDQPKWELKFSPEMQPLGILWFIFISYLIEKNVCCIYCAGQCLGFTIHIADFTAYLKQYVKSSVTFPKVPIWFGSGRADVTSGPHAPRRRVAAV